MPSLEAFQQDMLDRHKESAKAFVRKYNGMTSDSLRVMAQAEFLRMGTGTIDWLEAVLREIERIDTLRTKIRQIKTIRLAMNASTANDSQLHLAKIIQEALAEEYTMVPKGLG